MIANPPIWIRYVARLETTNPVPVAAKESSSPTSRFGSENGQAKLIEADILDIRNSKESGVALARRYDLNPGTISRIRRLISWQHV